MRWRPCLPHVCPYGLCCDLLSNFWLASATNITEGWKSLILCVVICFQIFG